MSTENTNTPPGPEAPSVTVPFNKKPRPKIYLAASAYDWKCETNFANSLIKAREQCHSLISFDWGAGDAAIGRKRNFQMWRFLKQTDADGIFYIDSDIIWEPQDLDRIVAHNLPICGGIYPKKSFKLEGCYNPSPGALVDENGLLDVKHAGNGFLYISRWAAERFIAYHGAKIEYRGDPDPELRWDFFPFGAKEGNYKSEDWYFCERAREAGLSVKIDSTVQVRHIGKIIFPLCNTITDEEFVDIAHHKYDWDKEAVRNWLKAAPKPPKNLDKPNT
jgi:hypothetical protein